MTVLFSAPHNSFRSSAWMRWSVSWGGQEVMQRSVCWRCCWSWWPPASKSPPSWNLDWNKSSLSLMCPLVCVFADSSVFSQTGGLSLVPTPWTDAGGTLSRRIWWVFSCLLIIYLPLCLTVLPSGFHQIMLARQAVRFRRRVTRKTTKQRLIDSRKLLRTLRLLAKEVRSHSVVTTQSTKMSTIIKCKVHLMCDTPHTSHQPQTTIPDVFLWLLSGRKRLAYVRIPANSVLFSLVEEQRGQDCGKVTTLYMKVTNWKLKWHFLFVWWSSRGCVIHLLS